MTQATQENSEETKTEEAIAEKPDLQSVERLSKAQQHEALLSVFRYLSDFDRVPGSQTANWSRVLDTLAVVSNNLAVELSDDKK